MIKKITLTALVLSLFMISSCSTKNQNKYYVKAKGGLNMRSSAGIAGKRIVLLPDGAQVNIINKSNKQEIIDGRKGRWAYVSWKEKKGWVFDTFLVKKTAAPPTGNMEWQKFTSMVLTCSDSGAPYMDYDQVEYTITLSNGRADYKSVQTDTVGNTTVTQKGTYTVSGNKIRITLKAGISNAVSYTDVVITNSSAAPARTITLHWFSKLRGFVPEGKMKLLDNPKYAANVNGGYFISKAHQKTKEAGNFQQLGYYRIKK